MTVSIVSTKRLLAALSRAKGKVPAKSPHDAIARLADIVGRLDPFHFQKGPQAIAMILQPYNGPHMLTGASCR